MCQWKLTKAEVEVPESFSNDNFLDDSDNETVEHEFVEDSDEDSGAGATKVESDGGGADDDVASDGGGDNVEDPEPVKKKVVKKVVRNKPKKNN